MRTRIFILLIHAVYFSQGHAKTTPNDKAIEFVKKVNSLDVAKLRLGQYDTLINKTADFIYSNDTIEPITLSKIHKIRGDLRLEFMKKQEKLIYSYGRDQIRDVEYSYERAVELDPSIKCNCLKQLKQLYSLDPQVIDNVEQKKLDIKRQIKKSC